MEIINMEIIAEKSPGSFVVQSLENLQNVSQW